MDRSEIVRNGCSGGCCEAFTMGPSLEDLDLLIESRKKWIADTTSVSTPPEAVFCSNGYMRFPPDLEELEKLREMLIPLGRVETDPANGKTFNEVLEYDPAKHTDIIVHNHSRGHYYIENGVLTTNLYTCKHFDKESRLCKNYDNRPDMCRSYGRTCGYEGCTFSVNPQNKL